jgi:hypothetical protein
MKKILPILLCLIALLQSMSSSAQHDDSYLRCLIYPNNTLIKIDGVMQPSNAVLLKTTHCKHQIQLWSEGHYPKDTTLFLNSNDTLTLFVLMIKTPEYKSHLASYNQLENRKNTLIIAPTLLLGASLAFVSTTYFSTKKKYNSMSDKRAEYLDETTVPLVHRKAEEHSALREKFIKSRKMYRTSLGVLAVSSISSYFMIRAARRIELPIFQDENSVHWQPIGLHSQYDGRLGLQTTLTLNLR